MKKYSVTGFSKSNVWTTIEVKTIEEFIPARAAEKGVVEITNIEEI